MNIEIHDSSIDKKIKDGTHVFKITYPEKTIQIQLGIVAEFSDYHKKLMAQEYNPMLYLLPFKERLCYLYGCLNIKNGEKRETEFVFLARKLNTDIWMKWFTVHPYIDDFTKD